MSEINDRRQRAREAFYDAYSDGTYVEVPGVELAIETATRVQITPEILDAVYEEEPWTSIKQSLKVAFRAAGFEVVE